MYRRYHRESFRKSEETIPPTPVHLQIIENNGDFRSTDKKKTF